MTGRGIDQILPTPSEPGLREPYVRDARAYVELAEAENGPIERAVSFEYCWGDALEVLERRRPAARIVNLETSVTESGDFWPGKSVHYRMHPANVGCLRAAGIDCCALANNHVLDFGYAGLEETLATLREAGIGTAGAGATAAAAAAPGIVELGDESRVLVFACGLQTSGIPAAWAARGDAPGVHWLPDLSPETAAALAATVEPARGPRDIVVVSIHWGGNWGYEIPLAQRRFAERLIDLGAADIVHGHSSHHAKGIAVHRGKPIFFGCGDLLTDYEGIRGHERYRGDLGLMYFITLTRAGRLTTLDIVPMRTRRLRLEPVPRHDRDWLKAMLDREGAALGTGAELSGDGHLRLHWSAPA